MAGGELRFGTASIYMADILQNPTAKSTKISTIHGYIIAGQISRSPVKSTSCYEMKVKVPPNHQKPAKRLDRLSLDLNTRPFSPRIWGQEFESLRARHFKYLTSLTFSTINRLRHRLNFENSAA